MKKIIFIISSIFIFSSASLMSQGCMEADSDEGVSVVGYIQPQFNYYFSEKDDEGNPNMPSTFNFKRARLGVVGSIPYDISYYAMAEFSPVQGGPKLLDAFITYSPFKSYLKFSIGQFKSPFGLELSTPCHALHTINRSTVVNELASPFREMGFMLLGSTDTLFGMKDFISYRFAYLNGTGINKSDDNKFKDIVARLVISPFEWLKIGGSFRTGKIGKIPVSGETQIERTRFGGDLSFEYKNIIIQGEYVAGEDIGTVPTGGGCGKSTSDDDTEKANKSGYMVQAMYMTPWRIQPIVKYQTFDPNEKSYIYQGVSQDFVQNTMTLGINYFLNDWTRIQINYIYNAEETANDEYKNDALLIQVQAKF